MFGPALFSAVAAGESIPVAPGYSTRQAMSRMAEHPYVFAAVQAVAGDLARLPIVAVVRTDDGRGEAVKSEPALAKLRNPTAQCTGLEMRRQLIADFMLTGNAYLWRPQRGGPFGVDPLFRLHPALVRPLVDQIGRITGYELLNRENQVLPWREVIHIRDISWSDTAEAAWGESRMRPLHLDLTTVKRAKMHAARSATRGRPEVMISLPNASQEDAEELRDSYERKAREGKGAIVTTGEVGLQTLSLTPRDLEFSQMTESVIYSVMAVMGVVPVRLGLPSANYGTSKQQMRVYWEGLQNIAALFDDAFSRLVATPGVKLEHSFRGVEALQLSRNERLERVERLVNLGASPKAAAAYEDLFDAPLPDEVASVEFNPVGPKATEPDEGQERFSGYLVELGQRVNEAASTHTGNPLEWNLSGDERLRCLHALAPEMDVERAIGTAEAVCDLVEESVHQALLQAQIDGVTRIDLAQLPVFDPARSARILRRAA